MSRVSGWFPWMLPLLFCSPNTKLTGPLKRQLLWARVQREVRSLM
jgi:hypothetical protein